MSVESAPKERHQKILEEVQKNPFILDEELAEILKVSIHTIRSDRRRLGIAEVRRRGREISKSLFASAKTLTKQEIIGDILEIELDKEGMSLLDTDSSMALQKTNIVRGHILFAQANSLANAIVNAEVALTAEARVRYVAPVYAGEKVLAKARILATKMNLKEVEVVMKTKRKLVFEGIFLIYPLTTEEALNLTEYENKGETKVGGK